MNKKRYRTWNKKRETMMKYKEKRRIQRKIQAMVARVYLYLKEEFHFMKMCNSDGCNIKPLSNCKLRTAKATGAPYWSALVRNVEKKKVQTRSPTKILNDVDGECLLIEDKRKNIEKRETKVLSIKKRIVKKRKIDNSYINTTEIETDTYNSDSSINENSPSSENLIEISESDKEEHEMSSSSSKSNDNEEEENLNQIVLFKNVGAERNDQVNINTAIDNNEEKIFPSTSTHQPECHILPLSIKNSVQPCKRQFRPNLQRILQLQDKETENNDQVDVAYSSDINENLANEDEGSRQFLKLEDQVTENSRGVEFPSTCIKQEEFETVRLSNTYTTNEDESLPSLILKYKAEGTEKNEQVNVNTETYYMIQNGGFPNTSMNLEEYKVLTSFNTYMDVMDFNLDEGQLLHPKLDSVRKCQDIAEVSIDSSIEHVASIEQGKYKILPSKKFAVSVLKEEEFEEEQELDPLSNMKQDCYNLDNEIEETFE